MLWETNDYLNHHDYHTSIQPHYAISYSSLWLPMGKRWELKVSLSVWKIHSWCKTDKMSIQRFDRFVWSAGIQRVACRAGGLCARDREGRGLVWGMVGSRSVWRARPWIKYSGWIFWTEWSLYVPCFLGKVCPSVSLSLCWRLTPGVCSETKLQLEFQLVSALIHFFMCPFKFPPLISQSKYRDY